MGWGPKTCSGLSTQPHCGFWPVAIPEWSVAYPDTDVHLPSSQSRVSERIIYYKWFTLVSAWVIPERKGLTKWSSECRLWRQQVAEGDRKRACQQPIATEPKNFDSNKAKFSSKNRKGSDAATWRSLNCGHRLKGPVSEDQHTKPGVSSSKSSTPSRGGHEEPLTRTQESLSKT